MTYMNELKGSEGELRMVVEIKRKATGKVETVELSGPISAEAATELGAIEGADFKPEAETSARNSSRVRSRQFQREDD